MNTRTACADPAQAILVTRGPHVQISLRTLQGCPECWGGRTTLTPEGRRPCPGHEGWRRVGLYNAALIPSALSKVTLEHAAMFTGSRLESAWRWLQGAPDLTSIWVKGDTLKRLPKVILAALAQDLTMARGVSARLTRLADLADTLVEHYKSGATGSANLRHLIGVDVLLLDGLDGVMRERDARALYWLAANRSGVMVFGATRTSAELSDLAGRSLGGDGAGVLRSWMAAARPMGWS